MKKLLVIFILISGPAYSWDGYDYNKGTYVEIERGNLVREGEDIEVYDYGSGEYRNMTVQSMDDSGSGVDMEVYDNDSGEYRTFEMDN